MSLKAYNPGGVPSHIASVTDRGQADIPAVLSDKITVLGCNNRAVTDVPLFQTFNNTALTNTQIMALAKNVTAGGELYASEISVFIAELQAAGFSNIEFMRIGDHDRLFDTSALDATHRFIMLENAYNMLVDMVVAIVAPVGLKMGLKGDSSYNALTYEYVYDETKVVADAGYPKYFRLTTATDGIEYNKGAVAGAEDLAYQLADFNYTSTKYNNAVFSTIPTIDSNIFKLVVNNGSDYWRLSGGASKTGAVSSGTAVDYANLNGADGVEDLTNGAARLQSLGSYSPDAVHDVFPLIKYNLAVESAASAQDLLDTLEGASYFNVTYAVATVDQKAAFELALAKWNMLYATPSQAELSAIVRYLETYGATNFDANGASTVGGAAIISFAEYDGTTSTTGKTADNFLYYATTDHKKPLTSGDASIITDAKGNNADIGVYIEVFFPHSLGTTSETATMRPTNPVARVSGLASQLAIHQNTPSFEAVTNKAAPSAQPITFSQLSKSQASRLGGARIQCFFTKSNGYVLSDGMTGAMHINSSVRSDYVRAMTRDILFEWIDNVRTISDPFTGKGIAPVAMASLEQKLNKRLDEFKEQGAILGGSVSLINQPGAATIGQLKIISELDTPEEIRKIIHETGVAAK